MPDPSVWADAIAERGFPAELDREFDVDAFSGFLPCRFDGLDTGFEYFSGPVEFIDELDLPDHFDFSVTFSAHSDACELASAVVCAAVLCAISGGILVDPQADRTVAARDAIPWAREQLEGIEL